jgi:D-glycero-D-manno-heptose 1,7-bisphosphate phosphatase
MTKAAFIERAGALYPRPVGKTTLTGIKFYPFVPEALSKLTLMGYLLIFVHNGTKELDRPVLQILSRQVEQKIMRLARGRFRFTSCFHAEKDKCACRLPNTGMIDRYVQQDAIDLSASVFFATSPEGVQAAEKAGSGTIMLLRTGTKGWRKPKESIVERYANFEKAVKAIEKENINVESARKAG